MYLVNSMEIMHTGVAIAFTFLNNNYVCTLFSPDKKKKMKSMKWLRKIVL